MITEQDVKKLTEVLATKSDVRLIHQDLIKHDERTNTIIEMLQIIREKLNMEV